MFFVVLLYQLAVISQPGGSLARWKRFGCGVPMVDAGFFVTLQHLRDGFGDGPGGRSGTLQQAAEDFADLRHRDGRCFFSRLVRVPAARTTSLAV